jgi:hypothetical protein
LIVAIQDYDAVDGELRGPLVARTVNPGPSRLSPGGAVAIGLALSALGLLAILLSVGAFGSPPLDDTPPWIGACAGFVFVLGGLALIVGYAIGGGVGPDGDLPAATSFAVSAIQYAFGLAILALMGLIGSWAALGPGRRHFTGTGTLGRGAVNELIGRVAFGFGAVLVWIVFAVMGVVGFQRLRRRRAASAATRR